PEAAWSIAFTGVSGVQSQWLVSGVYSCDAASKAPWAGYGVAPGNNSAMKEPPAACAGGNLGDIWRSANSGASWTSLRATSGAFPAMPTGGMGRVTLATGKTTTAATTVVYALLSSVCEDSNSVAAGACNLTTGVWRS